MWEICVQQQHSWRRPVALVLRPLKEHMFAQDSQAVHRNSNEKKKRKKKIERYSYIVEEVPLAGVRRRPCPEQPLLELRPKEAHRLQ